MEKRAEMPGKFNGISIRRELRSSDLIAVVELHREIYSSEYDYDESFVNYVAEGLNTFYSSYDPVADRVWVCERQGRLVGFLLFLHHNDTTVQLRYFLLHPSVRGLGLGGYLMDEFVQCLHERKITHAFLYTTSELPAAAHLYQQAGFKLTGSFPSNRFGKPVIEQRYDLRLPGKGT